MPGRKAFLVGISRYKDPQAADLPFIQSDLKALGTVLEAARYSVEKMLGHSDGSVSRSDLIVELEEFITSAEKGDELLISLSGHGLHLGTTDYIVPTDAILRSSRLADMLVPVDMGDWLEQTAAVQVVILIDACREGIVQQTMGQLGISQWSTGKVRKVESLRSAYIYACSKGQYGHFKAAGDDGPGFSLFSRAFSNVASPEHKAGTIGEVLEAVQDEINRFRSDYEIKQPQSVRLGGELPAGFDEMVIFDKARALPVVPAGEDEWIRAAMASELWNFAGDGPGLAEIQAETREIVRACRAVRDQATTLLGSDPWSDDEVPARILRWTEVFVSGRGADVALSAAEAGLAVAAPFVRDGILAAAALHTATAKPLSLEPQPAPHGIRAELEQVHQGYPHLTRRVARPGAGESSDAEGIAWWLLHRFLQRQPSLWTTAFLEREAGREAGASRLAAGTFTTQRLALLARCVQGDPARLVAGRSGSSLATVTAVEVGSPREQEVREGLIGYLLALAGRFCLDARALPDIVVEHLGIADPVSLDNLRQTLRQAEWQPRGRQQRSLTAGCSHPAIDVALHDHVRITNELLAQMHADAHEMASLAPLAELPSIVTAAGVGAVSVGGELAYSSSGTRFTLSEQDIRELLMGEQLYGDPALAIRELYQNALDACRYRRARIEYLKRTAGYRPDWSGRIDFRQGSDSRGRPYIECADNGVGMSAHELTQAFAQAGKRFSDLPEFLEEKAQWALLSPPVELHPNSQFGIGVLSYFMLADEIEVETCRMQRDGTPGERLLVKIAGPGSLFRILNAGGLREPGTRIRLWLNDEETRSSGKKISCIETLQRILWIAEFMTTAASGTDRYEWAPDVLSPKAPVNSHDPLKAALIHDEAEIVATADPTVYFSRQGGAVLGDGLWVGEGLKWAIVNLKGAERPRLAVHRTKVLSFDKELVEDRLAAGARYLLEAPDWLSFDWLWQLGESHPLLLQALDALVTDRFPELPLENDDEHRYALDHLGLFPPDRRIRTAMSWFRGGKINLPDDHRSSSARMRALAPFSQLPAAATSWRVGTLIRAGLVEPIAGLIIGQDAAERATPQLAEVLAHPGYPLGSPYVLWASVKLGMAPAETAQLLQSIGLTLHETAAELPASLSASDAGVLKAFDRRNPWEISRGKLITTIVPGLTPRTAAERLAGLGCTVPPPETLPDRLASEDDRRLAAGLPDDAGTLPGHLVAASLKFHQPVADVARRVRALGYATPDPDTLLSEPATDDDLALTRPNLDVSMLWYHLRKTDVSPAHLVAASGKFGRPVTDIARRMRALGYATPDPDTLLSEPATDEDLALSHVDLDPGKSAYQPRQLTVSPAHLVLASHTLGRPVTDIARRMRALGYATPDPDTLLSEPATDDDLALIRPDPDTFVYSYRSTGTDVSPAHLVAASHTLGRPVTDIVRRMRLLGYATPDPDAVTSRVADMSDVELVTRFLGRRSREISLAELLSMSRQIQLSPAATARWFGELGYTVMGYDQIPAEIRPLFQLDATARWWSATPPGDSGSTSPFWVRQYVSFGEILQESVKHSLAAKRCAEFLHACGYVVPEPSGLPDRVLSAAELELAQASGLQQEVDRATLLGAAHGLQLQPAELRRRLSGIGIQAAAADVTEWPPSALDVVLIEHLRPPDDVPRGWVIAIGLALNRPASTIAGRLRALGFEVDGEPPEAPDPARLAVLDPVSECGLAGQRTKVAMRWFLETCSKTSTAPAQLSAALRAVGFDAPPASADRVLPEDAPILGLRRSDCLERAASRVRGGESAFNTLAAPFNRWGDGQIMDEIRVPIPVLIGAGILLERPVQDIAERLYALGFDIADPATVTSEDVAHDITLLRDLWSDRPDHEWEILVDIAIRANWDLARAARRLYHYGLSLPAGLKLAPGAAPQQPAS